MLYGTELAETEEISDLTCGCWQWMLAVLQLECCAAHISVGLMIPPGFHGTSMDVAGKMRLQLETFGHFFLSIQLSESAHSMHPTISRQSPLHYSQVIQAGPTAFHEQDLEWWYQQQSGARPSERSQERRVTSECVVI